MILTFNLSSYLDPLPRLPSEGKLDILYSDVLRLNRPHNKKISANNWHYAVGALVALKIPLTYRDMACVLNLSVESSRQGMKVVRFDSRLVATSSCP